MASNITARKIFLRKSFLTRFRQFSSSVSAAAGIPKKSDKTAQPLESKDPDVSSSKWNDFLSALATYYSSSTKQGALKQVATTEVSPTPTSWTWSIKGDISYEKKNQEPEKFDATTKLTEEGLVIRIMLPGFKEKDLKLVVEENMLYVLGLTNISGETKRINEAFHIKPEHLFDAEKVTAKLTDGYLRVTFPKGTKETMATEIFEIKWT